MDPRLQHPFTCCCAGMTGCGKTKWVQKLLMGRETTIHEVPENIIWCYSEFQPVYVELSQALPHLKFIQGFPEDLDVHIHKAKRNLIILDDLMSEIGNDKRVTALFYERQSSQKFIRYTYLAKLISSEQGDEDHQSQQSLFSHLSQSS